MEDGKIKEFRQLLTTLEVNAEQDQLGERDRLLERNRQVYRFQEIKKEIILPTLRALMVDLDRKGHLTRLWEKTPEKLRFDVQIQTRVPKRGAIEISLHPSEPKLKVEYGWSSGTREEEIYGMEKIEAAFVTDRMMHLLRGLL
ncbi:MAG TPA: hypothetical protein VLB76_13630 [Thermoanaerobaculia bacterium]|nr:hypothetical protein [Thermoanaerobaculia bacterium]